MAVASAVRVWPADVDRRESALAERYVTQISMSGGAQLVSAQEVVEEPTWHEMAATLQEDMSTPDTAETVIRGKQRATRPVAVGPAWQRVRRLFDGGALRPAAMVADEMLARRQARQRAGLIGRRGSAVVWKHLESILLAVELGGCGVHDAKGAAPDAPDEGEGREVALGGEGAVEAAAGRVLGRVLEGGEAREQHPVGQRARPADVPLARLALAQLVQLERAPGVGAHAQDHLVGGEGDVASGVRAWAREGEAQDELARRELEQPRAPVHRGGERLGIVAKPVGAVEHVAGEAGREWHGHRRNFAISLASAPTASSRSGHFSPGK